MSAGVIFPISTSSCSNSGMPTPFQAWSSCGRSAAYQRHLDEEAAAEKARQVAAEKARKDAAVSWNNGSSSPGSNPSSSPGSGSSGGSSSHGDNSDF